MNAMHGYGAIRKASLAILRAQGWHLVKKQSFDRKATVATHTRYVEIRNVLNNYKKPFGN